MPTTPKYAIPYPQGSDAVNVPGHLQAMAVLLDGLIATHEQGTFAARPAAAKAGRRYLATDTGIEYLDTGSGWIEINPAIPPGVIQMYGGAAAPSGWLMCQGALVLQSNYSALFAVVGHAFNGGADPGGGQFRLPDYRGRAPIGAGTGTGLTARTLGALIGAESVALTVAEIPSHNHGGATNTTGNHSHGGGTGAAGGHGHGYTIGTFGAPAGSHHASLTTTPGGSPVGLGVDAVGDHAHAIGADGNHAHTISSQGGGGAHDNMQPSQATNFIIKA